MIENKHYSVVIMSFLFCLIAGALQAQEEGENSKKNEVYFGGGIHTRGFQFTAGYSIIRPSPSRRTQTFFAEVGEIKHPKENRRTYDGISIVGGSPKAFIYGKKNNLYFTRLGYGEKFYLSARNERLVSIGFIYGAGVSVGLVRPYYLDLIYRDNGGRPNVVPERFSDSNISKFLNPQEVDGPSGAAYGWDELSAVPGGFLKAGLLIDWGAYDSVVKDLEVGIAVDFYFEPIPLMIFEENTPIFVNLYITARLGHRW
jgi:hypothetical protein